MGVKNVFKNVGKGVGTGFKAVGKGAKVVSNKVVSGTFIVAQVGGLTLMLAGIIIMIIMSQKKMDAMHLKNVIQFVTGAVLSIVGIIMVGVSYGVRWKHRMVNRVTEIEQKWKPSRKTTSSLKRAYNINKVAKAKARQ